jgi:hypothetical protein
VRLRHRRQHRQEGSEAGDGAHVDISGAFPTGVSDCTEANNLAIDAATAISLSNGDFIHGNVLTDCSTACISATMTINSDRIYDNLIVPNGGNGIQIVASTHFTFDNNLCETNVNCENQYSALTAPVGPVLY